MASFSFSIKATGPSGSRTLSSHCCFLPSYGPSCTAPNWPILQLAAMCSMYLCIYPFINVMLERCTYLSSRKTLLLYLVLDFSTEFVQTTHHCNVPWHFNFHASSQLRKRRNRLVICIKWKNTFRRSVVAKNTSTERDKTWDLQFMGCYFLLLQTFFLVLFSTIWLLNYVEKIIVV